MRVFQDQMLDNHAVALQKIHQSYRLDIKNFPTIASTRHIECKILLEDIPKVSVRRIMVIRRKKYRNHRKKSLSRSLLVMH